MIYECLDIVKLLLKSVSKVDAMLGSDSTTPVHLEDIADRSEHLQIAAECLSKYVGKVDSTITRGTATPPHMAAAVDEPDLVELLLKLCANADFTDEFAFAALHWATRNGCAHTIRALLERASDITVMTKYKTTTLGLWMVSKDFMIMIMNLI